MATNRCWTTILFRRENILLKYRIPVFRSYPRASRCRVCYGHVYYVAPTVQSLRVVPATSACADVGGGNFRHSPHRLAIRQAHCNGRAQHILIGAVVDDE